MISSTSFLHKLSVLLFASFLCLSGCAVTKEEVRRGAHPHGAEFHIAVFPIENLSGTMAPLKEIKRSLINRLEAKGFHVLEEEILEKFMARNRVRYTGAIDQPTAQALGKETGVEGVLITSVELYSDTNPPKIALTARLVSTGDSPVILWIDGVGSAGDDSPGILGLGLIEDPQALLKKGLEKLVGSLGRYLDKKTEQGDVQHVKRKFRPKLAYRSDILAPNRKYTVAILPFINKSTRKNAGEIMVLHFARNLKKLEHFDVIEPGVVRRQLLALRMIIEEGPSLANADALFATLNADLILAGNVMDYQDYQGTYGSAKVDFSAQLIERKSRTVVLSSVSHNEGDDGVILFDWGRVNTAHAMASQMTQFVGKMILEDGAKVQGGRGSRDPSK
jgi:TolB-like protein